ncbi:MAG: phosphoribosylformylglycinamidine synthase, partial [SAR86 cluster bacterium]
VGMELCPQLGICIPVGKDSMSMRTVWKDSDNNESSNTSPLSLIITAFAVVSDIRATLTPQLRSDKGASSLFLVDLGKGNNRMGGSAFNQVNRRLGNTPPDVDSADDLRHFFELIQALNTQDLLLAYHDRSDGGLFTTVAEMAMAGRCGIDLQLQDLMQNSNAINVLFNEELGAVIQVLDSDVAKLKKLAKDYALGDCVHLIGGLNKNSTISINDKELNLWSQPLVDVQRRWARTSYEIQTLRDNSQCAQQEFDALLDSADPGLQVDLNFDVNEDITAPYINVNTRPRVAVLREQGVNGQIEMAAVFERAQFDAVDVHMTDIIEGRIKLADFNTLVACGGFSYGDVLGAGGGWAKSILFNDDVRSQFEHFFRRDNTLSLGVCNGCQMMSLLADLIPGSQHWPRFVRNASEQFEGRVSLVKVLPSASVFLAPMQGSIFPIAVAHGEGRAQFQQPDDQGILTESNKIALSYVDNYGQATQQYPANPNGSLQSIASVCSEDGRVTIMMPHPERVFRASQNSWHPDDWREDAATMRMFRNARHWLA